MKLTEVVYIVTLATGLAQITVKAPDRDVAIYRAKRRGFDAVSAHPLRGD